MCNQIALLVFLLVFTHSSLGQGLDCELRAEKPAPLPGQENKERAIQSLKQCVAKIDDRAACNRFVGKALEILYDNLDFRTSLNDYMLANDIANGLMQPGNAGWKRLGSATDQRTLDEAQHKANDGRPVLAVKPKADGPGHVALVLPGTLEAYPSGNPRWRHLRPPNAASAFLDKPERVFVGCPLSEVWRTPDGVSLYYKP